ncbi:hypothetical protein ACFXPT_35090 [Streptomyces goshikiensis]|uniref:hypothetical protein n=1 Tax=Streptomyces goshikiensis TaxID=1942 RepID=UPI00369A4A8F
MTSVSIMTFNIEQLPLGTPPWVAGADYRLERSRTAQALIGVLYPDVVVLNEAFSIEADALCAELADIYPHQTPLLGDSCSGVGWDGSDGACDITMFNGGVRILCRQHLAIKKKYQLVFRNYAAGTADSFSNKGAVLVCLHPSEGEDMWIVGTHLQADEGGVQASVRLAQMSELVTWAHEKAGNIPIVLAGDINSPLHETGPDGTPNLETISAEYIEMENLLGPDGLLFPERRNLKGDATYNMRINPRAKLRATAEVINYANVLDYIGYIGNGATWIGFRDTAIIDYHNYGFINQAIDSVPSDHHPMRTTVEVDSSRKAFTSRRVRKCL